MHSDHCEINPEYADPENFDQIMDIFATPSLPISQCVELPAKPLCVLTDLQDDRKLVRNDTQSDEI